MPKLRVHCFTIPSMATVPVPTRVSTIHLASAASRCTNGHLPHVPFNRCLARMAARRGLTMNSRRAALTTSERGSSAATCLDRSAGLGPTTTARFGNIFVQDLSMRCIWPFRRSCSVPENACCKVLTHPISAINAPNTFPLRPQRMSSSLSESRQRTLGSADALAQFKGCHSARGG